MSNRTLYFHAGFSKTGSTFMQRQVFPLIRSLSYRKKPKSPLLTGEFPYDGILKTVFRSSPCIWSSFGADIFTELFGPKGSTDGERTLLSDENACHNVDPHSLEKHIEHFVTHAQDWSFNEVKVVIVIRAQHTLFASDYAQLSREVVGASQSDFESKMYSRVNIHDSYFNEGINFNYFLIWSKLCSAIGSSNVLFVPYELMREDLSSFIKVWFNFFDLKSDCSDVIDKVLGLRSPKTNVKSIGSKTWRLSRLDMRDCTVFFSPTLKKYLGVPRIAFRVPDLSRGRTISLGAELEARIKERYAESNKALSGEISFDLKKYGYY